MANRISSAVSGIGTFHGCTNYKKINFFVQVHEMCHAASWIVSGYRDGHGPIWKAWAKKVMDQFTELPIIARCHAYNIRTKYNYRCTNCFYQVMWDSFVRLNI